MLVMTRRVATADQTCTSDTTKFTHRAASHRDRGGTDMNVKLYNIDTSKTRRAGEPNYSTLI